MRKTSVVAAAVLCWGIFTSVFGQQHTDNQSDRTLRGSGRVNPSTLGMEIDIPLGSYPGRGINVPVSLSYSSKVWRMEYTGMIEGGQASSVCRSVYDPKYAENSASGWTTSLAVPYIEYTGKDNLFNELGFPFSVTYDHPACESQQQYNNAYVRRINVHLPGGESHELRADDAPIVYAPYPNCSSPTDPNCDSNNPALQANWNRTFYATDGSNIKYVENSDTNTYSLQMPDGSYYTFAGTLGQLNTATIRKANRFTDRNDNFTSYDAPTGTWTDTLGKTLVAPIGLQAPASPTDAGNPQTYAMPGMAGNYKFHWKRLKGATAAESGLADFSLPLRYHGDKYGTGVNGNWLTRDPLTDPFLFGSKNFSFVKVTGDTLFNPVVLTEIELPTGQKYKFSYDVYGIIIKVQYPTGGEEKFVYGAVKPLAVSEQTNVTDQANRGVVNRKVYPTAGQGTFYEWIYSTDYAAPAGYKVSTTNPDGTKSERFLHRGNPACPNCTNGTFGYDNVLAGMAYKELSVSNAGTGAVVAEKLTNWTKSGGERHPRVDYETSTVYDAIGGGASATVKYEYEGDLSLKETPVLVNKTTQYAFVGVPAAAQPDPGEVPDPNPTPVPTPAPSSLTPVRITETTYLINDTVNYPLQSVRDAYKNQNMVGLATVSKVRDGAETIVSQSEMKYDDANYSPNVGRGNPTTLRVWDSTKGLVTNAAAYIQTRARFDGYGNQYEAIDAKGNITITDYDTTYTAFPLKVTTPVADPTGVKGSAAALVTEATFNYTTGLPLTTKDANGQITTIEYDPVTLRPKKVIPPSGAGTAETFYNDQPNNYWVKNKTQIDTNKWAESITYFDGLGRAYKSEEIDSQGNIFVEKEFDENGRVKRVTNPYRIGETKQWTTNVYDESSRVKEVILPDGAKVKTDYGVSASGVIGITKQITDQAGKKRKGITDALGRMVQVIEDPDSSNLSTDYVFDTLGNLRKTTQGEQLRYFSYDSLGRLLRAKQPEQETNAALAMTTADAITGHNQWSVKYEYDDNGNISKTTDARGVYIQGTYDKFNRLIFRDYSDPAMPDVNFYYDGTGLESVPNFSKGQTTKVSSTVSETRYTAFDNLGRLSSSEQRTPFSTSETIATAAPRVSTYQYNLSGALVQETYPSGRIVTNTLNADGELEKVESQKTTGGAAKLYLSELNYNSAGLLEKARLGNGRWESAQYNERLQVKQVALGHSSTDKSLLKIDYDYGTNLQNNGGLREQKISYAGLTNQITQAYAYDNLNRLKSATETVAGNPTPSWKQTFDYDRFGNRRFDAANTTTLGSCLQAQCNPLINTSDNRFSSGQGYSYDAAGNVTQDATNQRFVYDAENHQTQFFNSTNSTQTPDATYQYDGEGKRVRKISGQVETIFVYNGDGTLIAEYSTQISTTPQVSYLTQDHLGSPRIITDGGGAVISRHDYRAFGDEVFANVGGRTTAHKYGAIDEVRKQYTGYERDAESGLDYAQARYYNSSHGRFTSVDPLTASASIRDPQTFNRYSYVLNSPYKFTDPLGLLPVSVACAQWCTEAGSVDGSAFRGTDTSFDWADNKRQTQEETPVLVVKLEDNASLKPKEIEEVKKEISRIFADVNVEVQYTSTNDTKTKADYTVKIEPNGDAILPGKPNAVGFTPLKSDRKTVENYGTVFVDRLKKSAESTPDGKTAFGQDTLAFAKGLGRAATHEIGHYLLQQGFDKESIEGVMNASFKGKEWFSRDTRRLWKFDEAQKQTIKSTLPKKSPK